MHTNRISPARKIIVWIAAATGLFLLAGCETVTLTDLNPPSMAQNPSQIYTFSVRVTPRTTTVSGIAPHIVINGKSQDMKPSSLGQGIYDFEYSLPPGHDKVAYYYLVNYMVEGNGTQTPMEAYTAVRTVPIVGRYVLSLEVNRGPVGARIAVVGRGFTPQDAVLFNGTPVRTEYISPNAIAFFVPGMEPGKNYNVSLNNGAASSPVGTFRIDGGGSVSISPMTLNLRTGEKQMLTFTLPAPAPAGGTLLDVMTDIPDSVIMPEVNVPPGQSSVTIPVEGGRPGTGSLYLKGFGAGEMSVAVTVTGR